jgi:hypothetical protein
MSDDLSEFPKALRDDTLMPWEAPIVPAAGMIWQWGLDAGKALGAIESKELLRKRRWLEGRNGNFERLIQAIDEELTSRGGE